MLIKMTPSMGLIGKLVVGHIKYLRGIYLRVSHGCLWTSPLLRCLISLFHPSSLMKWSLRKSSHPYLKWAWTILVSVRNFLEMLAMGVSPCKCWSKLYVNTIEFFNLWAYIERCPYNIGCADKWWFSLDNGIVESLDLRKGDRRETKYEHILTIWQNRVRYLGCVDK